MPILPSINKTLTFYSGLFIFFLVLQRVSGLLTKIVLANSITPYEYGLITLVAISIPALLQIVTTLNFLQILAHSEEGKNFFGFSVIASTLLTIIVSFLLFVFRENFFEYLNIPMDQWELLYIVIIISLVSLTILTDFQGLYSGLKIYALPGFILAFPSVVRLLLVICALFTHNASFEVIILIFGITNAIPFLYLIGSRENRGYLNLIKTIHLPSSRIFWFGSAVFIVGTFYSIGQYLIKIVLSHELGVVWQGYYDVSLTLTSFFIFALGTMSFVSIPEATDGNKGKINERGGLGDVTRALFVLMVLIFLVLAFYSEYLVILLFSEAYAEGSNYIFILAIGYLFLFIQVFIANMNLSNAGSSREYIRITVIPLLMIPLFFYLTEYLIRFFRDSGFGNGFIGAYISYTILLIITTVWTLLVSKDLSPLHIIFRKVERLIISSVIIVFLIFVINPHPIVGITVIIVLFPILATYLGYMDKNIFTEIFSSLPKSKI